MSRASSGKVLALSEHGGVKSRLPSSAPDALVRDAIALLFDVILEESPLARPVKPVFARLREPVLDAALLDRTFFSSKSHAARRLLELLGEASIGVCDDASLEDPALALLAATVDGIEREFASDLAVFDKLSARVEAFLEERERAELHVVERCARLVEQRERDEAAQLAAETQIGRRLVARAWVPPEVREMLEQTWTFALAAAYRTGGEGSPQWNSLLWTMDELLWSVEPKVNPEDRKRLVTMLPGMIRELVDGMDRGAIAPQARDAFLGALVDCHASAVKAGLRGLALVPEAPAPAPDDAGTIRGCVVPAGEISIEEVRLREPRGGRRGVARPGTWHNLELGTWIELKHAQARARRARLAWISPKKSVYLFAIPSSTTEVLSISPEALGEQARLSEARILDHSALVDRAVGSLPGGPDAA